MKVKIKFIIIAHQKQKIQLLAIVGFGGKNCDFERFRFIFPKDESVKNNINYASCVDLAILYFL